MSRYLLLTKTSLSLNSKFLSDLTSTSNRELCVITFVDDIHSPTYHHREWLNSLQCSHNKLKLYGLNCYLYAHPRDMYGFVKTVISYNGVDKVFKSPGVDPSLSCQEIDLSLAYRLKSYEKELEDLSKPGSWECPNLFHASSWDLRLPSLPYSYSAAKFNNGIHSGQNEHYFRSGYLDYLTVKSWVSYLMRYSFREERDINDILLTAYTRENEYKYRKYCHSRLVNLGIFSPDVEYADLRFYSIESILSDPIIALRSIYEYLRETPLRYSPVIYSRTFLTLLRYSDRYIGSAFWSVLEDYKNYLYEGVDRGKHVLADRGIPSRPFFE